MKIPSKILKAKKLICEYATEYYSEFHCSNAKDANNNEYLYLHFKPRGNKSSFEGSICILNELKIRYAVPMQSDWKSLIFIPINQKLNYLVHSLEEVYAVKAK